MITLTSLRDVKRYQVEGYQVYAVRRTATGKEYVLAKAGDHTAVADPVPVSVSVPEPQGQPEPAAGMTDRSAETAGQKCLLFDDPVPAQTRKRRKRLTTGVSHDTND